MQNVNQICEIPLPEIVQNCKIAFLLQKECCEKSGTLDGAGQIAVKNNMQAWPYLAAIFLR